jgi:hypothetical protein
MDIPTKPTTCHKPIMGMEGGFKRGGNCKVAKPTKACWLVITWEMLGSFEM